MRVGAAVSSVNPSLPTSRAHPLTMARYGLLPSKSSSRIMIGTTITNIFHSRPQAPSKNSLRTSPTALISDRLGWSRAARPSRGSR